MDPKEPKKPKKRMGRPPGRVYPERTFVRLTVQDAARRKALARHWGCTEAEAVRRAIEVAAKAAGVDPEGGAGV